MNTGFRIALLLLLLSLPLLADKQGEWNDEEEFFSSDLMEATGSGGGPSMTLYSQDFTALNELLLEEGLVEVPSLELYWGGAGWGAVQTGERFFLALGGGGYGGASESSVGSRLSRWEHEAGYFSIKGVRALRNRFYVEAGVQLGGGQSKIWAEETGDNEDVIVRLRGTRSFAMIRPHLGFDWRLAQWVGILVEAGYLFTAGDWSLEGSLADPALLGNGNGFSSSLMVRFGI